MRLLYYIPQINPNADLARYIADEKSLKAIYLNLVDGVRTADDIAKLLLVNGHMISDIMTVMNELQKEGVISESSESDLGAFEPDELKGLDSQLKALAKFGFDKKSMFMPFSPSALSHQKRIKEGKVMLVGNGDNACQLILELIKIGIGDIHYYIHAAENVLEEEAKVLRAIETMGNPYSNIYLHKTTSQDLDANTIINAEVDVVIYMAENFSETIAVKINDLCKQHKKDFLPYQVSFPKVYIGPFYIYKQSACYKCFQIRKSAAAHNLPPQAVSPDNANLNISLGVDFICLEIVKYYSYIADLATVDNIWVLDVFSGKTFFETVFKIPRCPICGVNKIKPTKKLWENI
ncbi:MAG: hypothetical protein R2800_03700 [Flavipsychrobacter sp.]